MNSPFIVPLDLGDSVVEKSYLFLRRHIGEKLPIKSIAAYIGGAKKRILIDTGYSDQERKQKYHPYAKAEPLKPDQNVISQLAKAGVKPEEIDIVVLTHLHWDHVGGVTMFPNAEFIVSQEELRFALDPLPCTYLAYEALQMGIEPAFLKVIDRIKTVEMKEKEIVDGVKIIPLPGHTIGNIGVMVDTEKGPGVFAGEAAPMYGNFEGDINERLPYLMSGHYTDMIAMWKSFQLIDEIVGHDFSRVIPGHDPLVFKKKRYP